MACSLTQQRIQQKGNKEITVTTFREYLIYKLAVSFLSNNGQTLQGSDWIIRWTGSSDHLMPC